MRPVANPAALLAPKPRTLGHLEDARAAFERSLATGKRGKVVLRVAGDETAA